MPYPVLRGASFCSISWPSQAVPFCFVRISIRLRRPAAKRLWRLSFHSIHGLLSARFFLACFIRTAGSWAEARAECGKVLAARHSSTLRQVLEYSPQSTLAEPARRRGASGQTGHGLPPCRPSTGCPLKHGRAKRFFATRGHSPDDGAPLLGGFRPPAFREKPADGKQRQESALLLPDTRNGLRGPTL